MMKELKIGLLGFGAMGRTHTFSVSSLPFYYDGLDFTARYVAVCTSRIETARAAAEKYSLGYATVNEDDIINNPDIDVIDISTPNVYHFETAKKAIEAGKSVLCEKPLAVTLVQARELDAMAKVAFEKNGQVCGMVFNNRHIAAIRHAKELIESGRLGKIISFDFKYLHKNISLQRYHFTRT